MTRIQLSGVSVSYTIFSAAARSIKNIVVSASTGGRIGQDQAQHVYVQALDNIDLQLEHGDRVGLIGHNGAGKTTLLRVLAGIYEPEKGLVEIDGRITPLFDVALGIDPESTGYENIVLRGLYLGLQKAEILEKLDEVASFTDLGEFLSLPVRTYSTGMQARLAFAVATCVAPQILLMDEGVAAGDAGFFEKARRRLEEFIGRAGILVFASHSEEIIRASCNKVVLMERGRILWTGDVDEGFSRYRLATS